VTRRIAPRSILREAVKVAMEDMAPPPGSGMYGSGLSPEGYAGGYAAGLMDAESCLFNGCPSDQRRVFRRAEQRIRDRRTEK
jgi:hypothetical protein